MKLLRVLFSANSRPTLEMFENLSRSVWLAAASILFGMFRESDHSIPTFFFIGKAGQVVADGSADVVLRNGLGLWNDSAEGDDWIGNIKPILIDVDKSLAFSTNNDAGGDDRVDLLQIRAVFADGDPQDLEHKDPNSQTKYVEERNTHREWVYEYKIKQGAPAAAPVAPSVDAGWVAVAEVTRPNGQAGVTTADINDVRPQSAGLDFGHYIASKWINLVDGADLYFGDMNDQHSKLFPSASSRALNLATDLMGAWPDGNLNLGELVAWDRVSVDKLAQNVGSVINVRNAADDADGLLEAANLSRAWALVQWDAGGADFVLSSSEGVASIARTAAGQVEFTFDNPPADATSGGANPTWGPVGMVDAPFHIQGYITGTPAKGVVKLYADDGAGGFAAYDGGIFFVSFYW